MVHLGIRVEECRVYCILSALEFCWLDLQCEFFTPPLCNIWIWAVVSLPTVLTLDPLFCFVLITFPKEALPKVSRALERRCQMKCFLPHMFISLVYILSGHSKAFLIVEMSMIKTFQLINAVLYSWAVDLVLLSRLVQRLSRHLSHSQIAYFPYSEIDSSYHLLYMGPKIGI